jgi:hypothetical protein
MAIKVKSPGPELSCLRLSLPSTAPPTPPSQRTRRFLPAFPDGQGRQVLDELMTCGGEDGFGFRVPRYEAFKHHLHDGRGGPLQENLSGEDLPRSNVSGLQRWRM